MRRQRLTDASQHVNIKNYYVYFSEIKIHARPNPQHQMNFSLLHALLLCTTAEKNS